MSVAGNVLTNSVPQDRTLASWRDRLVLCVPEDGKMRNLPKNASLARFLGFPGEVSLVGDVYIIAYSDCFCSSGEGVDCVPIDVPELVKRIGDDEIRRGSVEMYWRVLEGSHIVNSRIMALSGAGKLDVYRAFVQARTKEGKMLVDFMGHAKITSEYSWAEHAAAVLAMELE